MTKTGWISGEGGGIDKGGWISAEGNGIDGYEGF